MVMTLDKARELFNLIKEKMSGRYNMIRIIEYSNSGDYGIEIQ